MASKNLPAIVLLLAPVAGNSLAQKFSDIFREHPQQLVCTDSLAALECALKEQSFDAVLIDSACAAVSDSSHGDAAILAATRAALRDSGIPMLAVVNEEANAEALAVAGEVTDDFLQLPLSLQHIVRRIEVSTQAKKMQAVLRRQTEEIEKNNNYLEMEQRVAKEVFAKIARDESESLPNIRRWLSPIAVFNGDVFLAAPTPGGGLLALLGDFTGHGLSAAIGAMPLATTFYGMAGKGFAMQDIIREINGKLKDILPVNVFCCAAMAHIDFAQGTLDIWNAGLPDCYLLHKMVDGENEPARRVECIPSTALALGILSNASLQVDIQRYSVAEGDQLYLLSDGVLESENFEQEQFGEQRLIDALAGCDDDMPGFDRVIQSFEEFVGDTSRADDISLVEIGIIDAGAFEAFAVKTGATGTQPPVSWQFQYCVRPDSLRHQDPIPLLLHALMEVPAMRQFSSQIYTIFTELYSNALDHGLLGLESSLKQQAEGFSEYYRLREQRLAALRTGSVEFVLDYCGDANYGKLVVDVKDSGKGFDVQNMQGGLDTVDRLHGRGIPLLHSICEQVEYLGNGNHARVVFSWGADVAAEDQLPLVAP